MPKNITLESAIKFHGHLGPYLVLGLLAGQFALKTLKCEQYFGLRVKVWGANKKPKSCLIDGLQLSTGATYGKGNIDKFNGPAIKIEIKNLLKATKITLKLRASLIEKLADLKTHRDSELLARKLHRANPADLFILTIINGD